MFLGSDTHTLDPKGRVVLPSRFRGQLSDGCVITKGQERQLLVFPPDEYARQAEAVRNRPGTRANRRFQRQFFSSADAQSLDKAGRLLVRAELRAWADLLEGEDVRVIGVADHIELWNPAAYEADAAEGEAIYTWDEEDELDESEDADDR